MDSITHIALGAVVGEAMAGKKLGKHAMFIGAIAQSLPDIDFVATFWMSFSENLLAHRGFTHSFLFVIITTSGLAFLADRWYRKPDMRVKAWLLFIGVQMMIHLLIDGCNAYGTGWFEPFSHARFSLHILFVADPFFSIPLGIATAALIYMRSDHPSRTQWIRYSLIISSLYLAYAGYNKLSIQKDVKRAVELAGIEHKRILTTPTPLNSWLWFVAVEDDSGFHISHRSVFDSHTGMDFHYFTQNKEALSAIRDQESLQHLIRFSQGYYIVESRDDKLIFSDLRFGQITGWATPDSKFVFHFYLSHPEENLLVIQRGRFANWNKETVRTLIKKIRGN
jgi:inner membrane protein